MTDGIITQSDFCPKAASHALKSQIGKKQGTFFLISALCVNLAATAIIMLSHWMRF